MLIRQIINTKGTDNMLLFIIAYSALVIPFAYSVFKNMFWSDVSDFDKL